MAALGERKFYDFQCDQSFSKAKDDLQDKEKLLKYIDENIIGSKSLFVSPYGKKKLTYCDYTASGRSLKFIEDYIVQQVLPHYGSTHTTTSVSSLQTSLFRHEARDVIRNAVRASEHDRVIFVGSGSTGAVHKLIHGLKLDKPPIVFVDFTAHHSSLLPWRESGALVIKVGETSEGFLDLGHLEHLLSSYCDQGRQMIGCFSAASNVTGILLDQDATTTLLHAYGALSFWDFATAAPYLDVYMSSRSTPNSSVSAHKDAIFFSLHKFIGGVQTPGVLVCRKEILCNEIPSESGGGTVFFVSQSSHRYLKDEEEREEGGTPPIVECIRGGMAMQLKMAVGPTAIMNRCEYLTRKLRDFVKDLPELEALGNLETSNRLPILSFMVQHRKSGLFLHHNFVSALLNDLFGVQSRGGCACAGPYAQELLGIDQQLADSFERILLEDASLDRSHLRRREEHNSLEVLRPGFVRINLPYTASDEQINFILEAVRCVAENGWKLLPQYIFNPETGEWKHHTNMVFRNRQWLQNISYSRGFLEANLKPQPEGSVSYQEMMVDAVNIMQEATKAGQRMKIPDHELLFQGEANNLRWFLLPSESQKYLLNENYQVKKSGAPFSVVKYPLNQETLKNRQLYIWEKVAKLNDSVSDNLSSNDVNLKDSPSFNCLLQSNNTSETNFKSRDLLDKNIDQVVCDATLTKNRDLINKSTNKAFIMNKKHNLNNRNNKHVNNETSVINNRGLINNTTNQMPLINDENSINNESKIQVTNDSSLINKQKLNNHDTKEISLTNKTQNLINHKSNIPINDHTYIFNSQNLNNHGTKETLTINNKNMINNTSNLEIMSPNENSVDNDDNATISCPAPTSCLLKKPPQMEAMKCHPSSDKKWVAPPKSIFNPTVEAIQKFNMIRDKDKVLVCLSGGKDSLSLLHTLRQYQFYSKSKGISFEMGAVTVDPKSSSYDPRPLIPYLASLQVPYFYEEQGILKQAEDVSELNSICSFCSRMKRGRIYKTARSQGFNVLALGQHLDDLAESFLMSLFHNGRLRTMKAAYRVREGDLRVIRPFVYVREKQLRDFAESSKLPIIPENCPACFEAPKERHRMKQLLAQQEVIFPKLYFSLKTALAPLFAISQTGVENNLFGKNASTPRNPPLAALNECNPLSDSEDECRLSDCEKT